MANEQALAATPALAVTTGGEHFAALLALEQGSAAEHHLNLIAWLLGLPIAADPATAARSILQYQRDHPRPALSTALCELLALVGDCSRERLDALSRNRRSFRPTTRSD